MDVETEMRDVRERLGALEKAVFTGNGKPPLLSRAESMEAKVSQLQKDIASIKGSQTWAVRLILSQIVVQLLAFGFRMLTRLT